MWGGIQALDKKINLTTCYDNDILLSICSLLTFLLLFFKSHPGQLLVVGMYFSVSLFPINSLTLTKDFNFSRQVSNSFIGS